MTVFDHKTGSIATYCIVYIQNLKCLVPIAPSLLLSLDSDVAELNANKTLTNQSDGVVTSAVDVESIENAENSQLGWLLASKAGVQLVVNTCMASVTSRYFHDDIVYVHKSIVVYIHVLVHVQSCTRTLTKLMEMHRLRQSWPLASSGLATQCLF